MLNFAQVSNRRIGKITFDSVTTEDHQSDLYITDNPIESGASISDHAVVKPKVVTINGIMVDHSPSSFGVDIPGLDSLRGGIDFLNDLPFPCKVVTKTAQTIARAGRLVSQGAGILKTSAELANKAKKLAPFLPDSAFGEWLDTSLGGDSRVQKCYSDLIACQRTGETIEVQTGIHLYKDMLIESIAVNQSQDGSATFTITAREIFIVHTQTVQNANSPSGDKKSGRAATQSAKKVQQGKTQTINKSPREKSSLKYLTSGSSK